MTDGSWDWLVREPFGVPLAVATLLIVACAQLSRIAGRRAARWWTPAVLVASSVVVVVIVLRFARFV